MSKLKKDYQISDIRVGDVIYFQTPRGAAVKAPVTRVNRKTFTVQLQDPPGWKWRIGKMYPFALMWYIPGKSGLEEKCKWFNLHNASATFLGKEEE